MAYYDQGFNVGAAYGNAPRAGFGQAILGGLQTGQALRKGQQEIQQGALKQQQQQEDRQTQQMGAQANAVTDQASYDRFRNWMKTAMGETEAGLLEDGLTPKYTTDVANVLQGNVKIAQGVPALKPKVDYTLGHRRYSGETDKVIAEAPYAPAKRKELPMDFAKKFNERLAMDIGEDLDELPAKDVKLIRNTTSAKIREGLDFENAYTSTLKELGLEEVESQFFSPSTWGGGYKLSEEAPQAQEGIPTGQSINQPDAREQELRAALEKNRATRKRMGYK
jgi:hypothetical protein